MTAILSNSLTELADRVKMAGAAVAESERTTAEKVIEAGWLLVQAKAQCPHGEWLAFLERAGAKERRARQWMQIAGSGLKSATVADLGIRGTLEFLSRWRLPAFENALMISDAQFAGSYAETQSVGRGLGLIWEDAAHRGYFNLAALVEDGAGASASWLSKPVLPELVSDDGGKRIGVALPWLVNEMAELPVSDWRLDYIPREHAPQIVLPFIREAA